MQHKDRRRSKSAETWQSVSFFGYRDEENSSFNSHILLPLSLYNLDWTLSFLTHYLRQLYFLLWSYHCLCIIVPLLGEIHIGSLGAAYSNSHIHQTKHVHICFCGFICQTWPFASFIHIYSCLAYPKTDGRREECMHPWQWQPVINKYVIEAETVLSLHTQDQRYFHMQWLDRLL